MVKVNSLIFNDIEVENDFRLLLKQRFAENDVFKLYKREINFVPMDTDLKNKVELPAVTFYIFPEESVYPDDEQLQNYTPFTAEINVYTSGDSKVLKNRQLCNIIIEILQSRGQLKNYFCRGLKLEENNEANTPIESAYRRVIRMSGLCENDRKVIR